MLGHQGRRTARRMRPRPKPLRRRREAARGRREAGGGSSNPRPMTRPAGQAIAKRGAQPQNAAASCASPVRCHAGSPAGSASQRQVRGRRGSLVRRRSQPMQQTRPMTNRLLRCLAQARSGAGNDGADTRQGGSDGRSAAREARRGEPDSRRRQGLGHRRTGSAGAGRAVAQRQRRGDRQRRRRRIRLARGGAFVVRAALARRKITRNRCAN